MPKYGLKCETRGKAVRSSFSSANKMGGEGMSYALGDAGDDKLVKKVCEIVDILKEPKLDTETQILCDLQTNKTQIEFRAVPVFNELTGAFISMRYATLADIAVDYVPTGIVGLCKNKTVKSWEVCLPTGEKYMACMQVIDGVGQPTTTIYLLPNGTSAGLTAGQIALLEFCKDKINAVTGGGTNRIAGELINATGTGSEFDGAPLSIDSSFVSGQLQSITIIAKGITDGRKPGSTPNQIVVNTPDGSQYPITNGTYTYQVQKDTDTELRRDYRFDATGEAYAHFIYTFI